MKDDKKPIESANSGQNSSKRDNTASERPIQNNLQKKVGLSHKPASARRESKDQENQFKVQANSNSDQLSQRIQQRPSSSRLNRVSSAKAVKKGELDDKQDGQSQNDLTGKRIAPKQ